jgi:SpoIID/LytB domain protein
MTDVSSASIGSSSGLIINRTNDGFRAEKISASTLHIELRKQNISPIKPGTLASSAIRPSTNDRYTVLVGSSSDARNARKLADRLKAEFFEPVTTSFDEPKHQYVVTIGHFTSRDNAESMVRVLHNAGYKAPVVVGDQGLVQVRAGRNPELATDTNARAAKNKVESKPSKSSVSVPQGKIQMVAIAADQVVSSSENELIVAASDSRTDLTSPVASLRVDNKDYRGEIHFIANPRGKINVVNVLPLEQYLRGVVPMEISSSAYAEFEAIKAQAVASRSFALASIGQHQNEGYDLFDDTRSQVYGGLSAERELSNRAVEQTRGIVAAFPNETGKLEPIEALFTANCGGRTENNEEVFGGKAVPYLRSVPCVTDRQSLAGRDIVTTRTTEPMNASEGRSVTREVALLNVFGFSLPRRVSNHYLHGSLDQDEARNWTDTLAKLTEHEKPAHSRADETRLAEFARLVAASLYGEDRATRLKSPADVDYLLAGLRVEQLPPERRADVATLLRDGIFRLADDGAIDGRTTLTRGQAIEMIGRAILLTSTPEVKSQISRISFESRELRSGTAAPADKGRLIVARSGSTMNAARISKAPGFVSINASSPGKLANSNSKSARVAAKTSVKPALPAHDETPQAIEFDRQPPRQTNGPSSMDIAEAAWLFRAVGGESYAVDRLTLVGGEHVTYHLNAAGRVDFLEASISERSAFDTSANLAPWQERVTAEELQQRLARAHINVGRPELIEPAVFSASTRIIEVDLSGSEGHARLRIPQIRNGLGLKEHLFTIDRETDSRGRLVAFVFTGRGSGHGVGMCQAGAYRMADAGYSYTAILQKFYTGIQTHKAY